MRYPIGKRWLPFYYDDGEGHAVMIRQWLPYGHPDRVVVLS